MLPPGNNDNNDFIELEAKMSSCHSGVLMHLSQQAKYRGLCWLQDDAHGARDAPPAWPGRACLDAAAPCGQFLLLLILELKIIEKLDFNPGGVNNGPDPLEIQQQRGHKNGRIEKVLYLYQE